MAVLERVFSCHSTTSETDHECSTKINYMLTTLKYGSQQISDVQTCNSLNRDCLYKKTIETFDLHDEIRSSLSSVLTVEQMGLFPLIDHAPLGCRCSQI